MSTFSDSYVSKVLLATHTPTRGLETVAGRWRWLGTSLLEPICAVRVRNGGRSTHAAKGARPGTRAGSDREAGGGQSASASAGHFNQRLEHGSIKYCCGFLKCSPLLFLSVR